MYPVYNPIGNREECEEILLAFPPQHQDRQPGLESVMIPRPIAENPYAAGSGKLQGRSALITGGDSGIGRAVSIAFAKEGADVAIAYLNEHEDARDTQQRVEQLGRKCILIPGDLKQEENARHAVSQTVKAFGKLDILVNNHAMQFIRDSILDISAEQMDLVFKTNIYSFFYLIKAALPYMARGSAIINTASTTAYYGAPQLIDYSATKGAIVSLTRSLALSLVGQGIRVNGVAPGPVWTPLQPSSYPAKDIETFGTKTARTPMDRAGQPFEISPCYVFLASDDSSFMTGQFLHPDGGSIGAS